jgi:uncharacterized protein
MKLAINYSRPAASLVQSAQITVDYFKTPDWEWMIDEAREIRPAAVHFTLEAGNNNLGQVDWDRITRICESTGTPYINLHLDARGCYYPGLPVETTDQANARQVVKIIQADIEQVVEKFGPKHIILENSPYRAEEGNTMRCCVEPDLVRQMVEETGCGLLLDISHALITSRTLAMEPREYLKRLPVNRIKELHFAGIHRNPMTGQWMDHLSIQEEDWTWLDWVLERIRGGEWSAPWMLAFEYGGIGEPFEWRSDPQVIAEQVPQLFERVNNLRI